MPSKILTSSSECMEPVNYMGYHADLKKSSRNHQTSRTAKEKISFPPASRSLKVREKVKSEKHISHHEIRQNIGNGPLSPTKSPGIRQKQFVKKKTTKDDELVKHMSNLPCYLQRVEREENLQEKVLNFGVLDWGRLERWKYNQKQFPGRSSTNSQSTSRTSLPLSKVGSSTLSGGSDIGFPAPQRKQSSSLHSHLTSSRQERHSRGFKPSRGTFEARHGSSIVPKNASVGQQKLTGKDLSSGRNYSEIKPEKGKGTNSDPNIIVEMGTSSSNTKGYETLFCAMGTMKGAEGESTERMDQFQEFTLPDHHCPGRRKTIVLLLPRDSIKKGCSGVPQQSESTMLNDGRQTEANRRSFKNNFCINEVQFTEPYSVIPHSCPLPCRVETGEESDMNLHSSVDDRISKVPSDISHSFRLSDAMPTVLSKDKLAEDIRSTIKPSNLIVMQPFNGSGSKDVVKGKIPSPNRRSSVGFGRVSRSFSFKDGSGVPQLSSSYLISKSGPVESDSLANNSKRDKTTANSRSRSSPLRRLLDPLLKPKAANRLNSAGPLQDKSEAMHRASKSSDAWLETSIQPVKRNLYFSSSRPTDTDGLHWDERHMALMVQALLQVTVRNGLPCFTFAVDNKSDILEATMRKLNTSGKHDCSWMYTFYSFHKNKKKSGGWMHQGSTGRSREYLRDIIGQMKVSSSQCSKFTRYNSNNQFMVREFVLFGVEARKADQENPDFQPSNELAAIVVKVPKETMGSLTHEKQQSNNHKVLSKTGLSERLPEDRCSCNSGENQQSRPIVGSESFPGTVVILPSGLHGLSADGVPSPLIDRWISGGSCDCGGWDVGCKLRIFSDQDQCNKNLCLARASFTQDQFDLFLQGEGAQENRLSLSLTSYSKGIYSVDFNASISSLQVFSICIAFLHNRNIADLSEVSNLFREITSQEPISKETDRIKVPTQLEEESPPSYAPFPPLSPVGRA